MKDINNTLTLTKALSDVTRVDVIGILLSHGKTKRSDLKTLTKVEETLLSHHLKVLKDAGLVESMSIKKERIYSLCKGVKSGRWGVKLGEAKVVLG